MLKKAVDVDGKVAAAVLPAGAAAVGVLFGLFGVSAADYLKFLGGLFVFVYAPGRAVLDLLPGRHSPILTPVAGMAACTLVHKYARLLNVEFLFVIGIAAAVIHVIRRIWRSAPGRMKIPVRITRTGAILFGCVLLIAMMLAVDSYRNGRPGPGGSVVVRMHYYDGFVRNAVVGELSHSLPPQMPFAAGIPLGYHYGMDLFISLFVRYLGLGVFDLVFRLLATFFWVILLLSVFLFGRTLYHSSRSGLGAAILVVFGGGGWTWVAALARGTPLGGNPFYALYPFDALGVNSLIPGFALAFGGLAVLVRFLRERSASALILGTGLLAAAVEFKIFLGPPLIGALVVTGIVAWIVRKDPGLLQAGAAFAAGLLPLFISALALGQGGPPYHYAVRFIDWPGRVLADLRFERWADLWNGLGRGDGLTAAAAIVFPAALGLTLAGACGPSLVAVPRLRKEFFAGPKDAPRFLIAGLAGACFAYFFFFNVRLGTIDRTILNVYVFYFGLMILLISAADVLARGAGGRPRVAGPVLLTAAVVLALPNTVLFLRQKMRTPEIREFSAAFLETADWLKKNTPATTVILHPIDIRHLCYFAARRVVLDDSVNSYLDFHLLRKDIGLRRDGINRFFADPARWPEVLDRYGVSFVVRSNDRPFPDNGAGDAVLDADAPGDPIRGSPSAVVLKRVFRNPGFTIYRVAARPEPLIPE